MSAAVSRHRGFTLLELIVALAITAVIGMSLYGAMSVAFAARDSAERQTTAVRQAAVAMEIVQRELESALPPRGVLAGPFVGQTSGASGQPADAVEFHVVGADPELGLFDVTGAPGNSRRPHMTGRTGSAPSEGFRWVQFGLRSDGESGALVRRVERDLLSSIRPEPAEEVILTGVRSFGLRYFDGLAWHTDWDSTQHEDLLPLAVEVTIELDGPSPTDAGRNYRVTQLIPLAAGRAVPEAELTGGLP